MLCKLAHKSKLFAPLARHRNCTTAPKPAYDCVIIGGGHNGLVAAAYLQEAGLATCVVERRHLVGGAAVSEELVPGFKFSRASYLLSLLRPQIIEDLKLYENGLKVYARDPSSFTPLKDGRYLLLGMDSAQNKAEIAKFSRKDAEAFEQYEKALDCMAQAITPLLDKPPADVEKIIRGSLSEKISNFPAVYALLKSALHLREELPTFFEILTAPAHKILSRWFESEPLCATLATDAVIGAMASPLTPGSAYVLFHHVMGEVNGIRGAWGYVEGGMGALSEAIARVARKRGSEIFLNQSVREIIVDERATCAGVLLADGTRISAKYVLSNATPEQTFLSLMRKDALPASFRKDISAIQYTSPVTKLNVAVDALPNFKALPNTHPHRPMPHHQCTIHLGCESMREIDRAFRDAENGVVSEVPMIEMCIPSALDATIAPPGKHVLSIFVQYTPYHLREGSWRDAGRKEEFAAKIFAMIDEYAPGFRDSVLGWDMLTPVDLEEIFSLTGGNIFHGSMRLDQLYFLRPTSSLSSYQSPIHNLYLCGSGGHPGGGVMGAAGRNSALQLLRSISRK